MSKVTVICSSGEIPPWLDAVVKEFVAEFEADANAKGAVLVLSMEPGGCVVSLGLEAETEDAARERVLQAVSVFSANSETTIRKKPMAFATDDFETDRVRYGGKVTLFTKEKPAPRASAGFVGRELDV